MKRKVNRVGQNTLTVSLPAKWVKKYGLKAGIELDMVEEGNKLIINQSKEIEAGEVTVDIPEGAPFAKRFFIIPYIKGYNSIKIYYHTNDILENIQKAAPMMLGFEIVEQTPDYVVFKNIAKGIESEFDSMFNRQILVVIAMSKELYKLLKEKKVKDIEKIIEMDNLTNRLNVFCRRMLNIHGYKDDKKTNAIYHISCLIESTSDNYRIMCKEILAKKIELSKEALAFMKKISEYLDFFYHHLNKYEAKHLSETKKIEKEIEKDLDGLRKKESKEQAVIELLASIYRDLHHSTEELMFVSN
ncbi:hypothetical protein GOV06_04065 [Candidatus Woesearchaeota archaeon]|nr:hypothetical protein [Candidatus Woesearchaeota archaeon]